MGGKGETVKYDRIYEKGPLSDAQKKDLIDRVTRIINTATASITVQILREPTALELKEALDAAEKKKREGY